MIQFFLNPIPAAELAIILGNPIKGAKGRKMAKGRMPKTHRSGSRRLGWAGPQIQKVHGKGAKKAMGSRPVVYYSKT